MDLAKFIAATPAQRWASAAEVGEVGAAWCCAHCLPTAICVPVWPLQIRGFMFGNKNVCGWADGRARACICMLPGRDVYV